MYYIYTIFNKANGKIYVGKTSNPNARWRKHIYASENKHGEKQFYFHRALKKYGINSFTFSILQIFNNEKDSFDAERYWIKYFKSNINTFGYNLTEGGEGSSGNIMSEEAKKKISLAHIGMTHSANTIIKMSGENNHHSRLKLSDVLEIRKICNDYSFIELSKKYNVSPRNISCIVYNKSWHDDNYVPPAKRNKSKINNITVRDGMGFAQKYKSNISMAMKGKLVGEKNSFYGKTHSEEVKNMSRGENNKQAKLTTADVINIRKEYKTGIYSQQEISIKYKVSRKQIGRIVNMVDWKHIKENNG